MKKVSAVSLALCLMLLAQCFALSGCGKNAPAETVAETAAPLTPVSAKSLLLYDADRGTDVCAYAPDAKAAPGALTKLVTSLIALETCGLEDPVTAGIYDLPAGSMHMDLKNGEVLTVQDLAAAAILDSANDAAMALAEHVAGFQAAFVEKMNQRIAEMGCTDTKFTDATGLDTEHSYTTAHDLVKIVEEAVKNDAFRELFGTRLYEIPATEYAEARQLFTRNYMMDQAIIPDFYDERVTGGVQSFSREAGASLVCTVEGNYIAVVLGAERIFNENGWGAKRYGNFEEMTALLAQYLTK